MIKVVCVFACLRVCIRTPDFVEVGINESEREFTGKDGIGYEEPKG